MNERSKLWNIFVLALLVGALCLSIFRYGGVYWEWLVLVALSELSQAPRKVQNGLLVFAGAACAWTLGLHWVPGALWNYGQVTLVGGSCALLVVALTQALPFALLIFAGRLGRSSWQRAGIFALAYGVTESWWPWFAPYSASVALVDTYGAEALAWVGRSLIAVLLAWLAVAAVQMRGLRRLALVAVPLVFPHCASGETPAVRFTPGVVVQVPSGQSTTADERFHSYARQTAQLKEHEQGRRLIFWGERASPKRADESWHRRRVEHLIHPGEALLFWSDSTVCVHRRRPQFGADSRNLRRLSLRQATARAVRRERAGLGFHHACSTTRRLPSRTGRAWGLRGFRNTGRDCHLLRRNVSEHL